MKNEKSVYSLRFKIIIIIIIEYRSLLSVASYVIGNIAHNTDMHRTYIRTLFCYTILMDNTYALPQKSDTRLVGFIHSET